MKTRLFGVLLILALALVPHTVQAQAKAVELKEALVEENL